MVTRKQLPGYVPCLAIGLVLSQQLCHTGSKAQKTTTEVGEPKVGMLLLPLPRNGGTAETHGNSEAGQLRRAWTRSRRASLLQQRVVKERAAQRVRSLTIQKEMRGVLRRMSSRAAWKILDSTDSIPFYIHNGNSKKLKGNSNLLNGNSNILNGNIIFTIIIFQKNFIYMIVISYN